MIAETEVRPEKARVIEADLRDRFFQDLRATGRSEKTLAHYSEAFNQFWGFYFAHDPFRDPRKVRAIDVQAFLVSLRKRKLKDATVQARYRALHRFFGWLVKYRYIDQSPMQGVSRPRVVPEPVIPYTDSEVRRMLEATRCWPVSALRDQVMIYLLYNTGMRVGELATLTAKDVHVGWVEVRGKGKKKRSVALEDITEGGLRQYMAQPVPLRKCLFGLSVSGIQQTIYRLANAASVPGAHVHRFRDTFAVRFLENGGGINDLQIIMGHADIETTQRYVMYGNEDRALAAQRKFAPFARFTNGDRGAP